MSKNKKRWDCIATRFKKEDFLIGAEIGVYKGKMSQALLTILPNLNLYMIDRWTKYSENEQLGDIGSKMTMLGKKKWKRIFKKANRNTEVFAERRKIIRLSSEEASKLFPDNFFDFIFVDADHSRPGAKKDCQVWFPKVKSGGYICGHDYTRAGVNSAVKKFFKNFKIEKDADKTWFVKKI